MEIPWLPSFTGPAPIGEKRRDQSIYRYAVGMVCQIPAVAVIS
ncbi:MAG: hypothetical protein Q8914_08420 [Bacteroidota bacterium]|nr:hypothetical protein [Bacteroidota bacterium]